ncbi:UNVERIFIED_CONTAM: putative signal peptidase complex subunit [Sesamum radiatum]|uniref:Signal peptidase complex subunit 2 n=1 Tax=Sesamum radiatum TaxID=300843 RepID=A0AAW2NC06_SESRA
MATKQNPKKANLLDHHSIKHILDESVTEIVTTKGYPEDVRMSNIRLFIGVIIIVVALFAQFYNKKFPENRNFLIGCIALYPFFDMSLCLDLKRPDGWDFVEFCSIWQSRFPEFLSFV